jgi:nitrogenase molybdenum-iron protein NifN
MSALIQSDVENEPKIPEAATRNACKLCSPLGAAMVFKGIRGCLPFLHGSQGCATYIRRYMISHFREPVDIASSSFSEDDAIFGGARNFEIGIDNVIRQYAPEVIGVATTCLSETIGDNMIGMIKSYQEKHASEGPPLVHVSTPAYTGTHSDGYLATIKAVVQHFAISSGETRKNQVNVLPPMASCADLRYLKELCEQFGLDPLLIPDYSTTLEGESWDNYNRISPGGTSVEAIATVGQSAGTLEIGHQSAHAKQSAGAWLEQTHGVAKESVGWPIGIRQSDQLMASLATLSGKATPEAIIAERGRLVDAYVDGHKYVSGKTAAVFGDPDLVISMAAFLSEIGIRPVICATGSKVKNWSGLLAGEIENGIEDVLCLNGVDHAKIREQVKTLRPDMLVGSSKGYPIAREFNIPLMRVGFPVHDRFGAQRQLTMGYRGTQQLFDTVVNLMMEAKQNRNEIGYSYI